METQLHLSRHANCCVALCLAYSCATSLRAQDDVNTWSINPSAKSLTLLAASIPGQSDVVNVQVTISAGNEPLRHTGAAIHGSSVPWSVRQDGDEYFAVVPLPASFEGGHFLFPEPGEYRVHWLIGTTNPAAPSLIVEQ